MSTPEFSPELRQALKDELAWSDEAIDYALSEYMATFDRYGREIGAPRPEDLVASDVHAVIHIEGISALNGESWEAFNTRMKERAGLREDVQNVWMPNWTLKAADKPTPWLGDSGQVPNGQELPENFRKAVTRHLRECVPYRNTSSAISMFGEPVSTDLRLVRAIAEKFADLKKITVDGMGESSENPEFRWSRSLVMLTGLGIEFFRVVAKSMRKFDTSWDEWYEASDDEIKADAIKAREMCGYPGALLRGDFTKLRRACGMLPDQVYPKWMKYVFVLHLLKHVRFIKEWDGKPQLHVAYQGHRALVPLSPENLGQSMMDSVNFGVLSTICRHLDLTVPPPDGGTELERIMREVLSLMHPTYFVEAEAMSKRCDVLAAGGVSFSTEFMLRSDYRWINPGIEVKDVATIDTETGIVDKDASVVGADALNIAWPFKPIRFDDKLAWLSTVPDQVEAKLPSEIIKSKILNVNTLGVPEGFWTMLDGLVLTDLIRDELHGTKVGLALKKEFPLVFVFPMGHELETTTNQGKTTLAMLLANIMVPDLKPDQTMKTTSAPAQRQMSTNLARYGTAMFDEFMLPQAHDHMLSQSGLQSWATGVGGGPGRAGENAEPIFLQHPLFFTAKLCDYPPDLINRMFPCFMDAINETNTLSGEQLTELVSGAVAPIARLSALFWIKKNNFIEKVRAIKTLTQGVCRFTGHASIMNLLTDDVSSVKKYFVAAEKQCAEQLRAAEHSGLAENIGASITFDPVYYFNQLRDNTLSILAEQFATEETTPIDALRMIVEDQQRRVFNAVLTANKCREATAIRLFKKAITDGRMYAKGYMLTIVSKKTGNGRGRPTDLIRLEKESAKEVVPSHTVKT